MAEPIDVQWAGRRRKGNSSGPEPPPKPAANYSSTCRSCRGILVYAPLLKAGVSGRTVSAPEGSPPATATSTSWTSPQPVCLGLSSAALEELSPQSIYAARQLPEDQKVSFLLVVGHAIFTPGGGAAGAGGPPQQQQALPPVCYKGLEVLRFAAPQLDERQAAAPANMHLHAEASSSGGGHASSSSGTLGAPRSNPAAAAAVSSLVENFPLPVPEDLAPLLSSARAAFQRVMGVDPAAYAAKFAGQADKNMGIMSKWLQDLRSAVVGNSPSPKP